MITVETTADFVGCGACGIRAVAHERKLVAIRDLACFGRPARLVWRKRRWRCVEPACEAKTWTEDSEHVDAQVVLTRRAGAEPEARDRFEQWFTQLERFIREEIALVPSNANSPTSTRRSPGRGGCGLRRNAVLWPARLPASSSPPTDSTGAAIRRSRSGRVRARIAVTVSATTAISPSEHPSRTTASTHRRRS